MLGFFYSYFKYLRNFRSVRLRLKSSSLRGNIFADDCARELFKLSKDLESLRFSNEKKF